MMTRLTFAVVPAVFAFACGASMPPPTQRLADAQSAQRAAQELGAAAQPSAQLHLKLAEEQTAKAKQLMNDGKNEEANSLLVRAKADAELAVALAREQKAGAELQDATKQESAAKNATEEVGK